MVEVVEIVTRYEILAMRLANEKAGCQIIYGSSPPVSCRFS